MITGGVFISKSMRLLGSLVFVGLDLFDTLEDIIWWIWLFVLWISFTFLILLVYEVVIFPLRLSIELIETFNLVFLLHEW